MEHTYVWMTDRMLFLWTTSSAEEQAEYRDKIKSARTAQGLDGKAIVVDYDPELDVIILGPAHQEDLDG